MIKLIASITQVDSTTPVYNVGSRTMTNDGNEYIYLPGTDSVAKYNWVVFKTISGLSYGSVTRMTTGVSGPVGIAQGAITSNKYGWFGIYGMFYGLTGSTTAAGGSVYASGTAACADSIFQAGVNVIGAIFTGAGSGAASGTGAVMINHPFLPGVAI